jgi:hypothetical protein
VPSKSNCGGISIPLVGFGFVREDSRLGFTSVDGDLDSVEVSVAGDSVKVSVAGGSQVAGEEAGCHVCEEDGIVELGRVAWNRLDLSFAVRCHQTKVGLQKGITPFTAYRAQREGLYHGWLETELGIVGVGVGGGNRRRGWPHTRPQGKEFHAIECRIGRSSVESVGCEDASESIFKVQGVCGGEPGQL